MNLPSLSSHLPLSFRVPLPYRPSPAIPPLSLPYRPSPPYTERSKWIITLAANDLTYSHLRKILGSICAEDFQHLTLYQALTGQLIIQHQ